MTELNSNNNASQTSDVDRRREADDRVIDWGLETIASKETPPDLTQQILNASQTVTKADSMSESNGSTSESPRRKRSFSRGIAVSICFVAVCAFGYAMLPSVQQARVASNDTIYRNDQRQRIGLEQKLGWNKPLPAEPTTLAAANGKVASDSGTSQGKFGDAVVADDGVQSTSPMSLANAPAYITSQPYGRLNKAYRLPGLVGRDAGGTHSGTADGEPFLLDGREVHFKNKMDTVMDTQEQGYTVQVPATEQRTKIVDGKEVRYNVTVMKTEGRARKVQVPRQVTKRVLVDAEGREVKPPKPGYSLQSRPRIVMDTQSYTVQVPVTEERTKMVDGKEVTYNVTVMKSEGRTRQVPRQVQTQTPVWVDASGREIPQNSAEGQKISKLMTQQTRDRYVPIHENLFTETKGAAAVSTFSIDVDTASYSNVRQYLKSNQLPPPNAVRIEELVNYFDYNYAGPGETNGDAGEHPFATHTEVATCPWNEDHHLVRVGIKGREVAQEKRPLSNVVFLVDVSGSMNESNKLPLVIEGLTHMAQELGENDRVAVVVYASAEGLALPSTRGDEKATIINALSQLSAGGSTAGGAGINLAYKVAEENFIKGGTNRVILCTDGDFNVGVSDTNSLEELAKAKAKDTGVFLTVLGYGRGNLNDEMMEKISNSGNGNYHYIDSLREARRVLVHQLSGTLVTIAKDVKIQIEFNPSNVAAYRLLGYENRMLEREDFNDDTKDAGEIGAGHTVTALYEVVPAGTPINKPKPKAVQHEPLKYQSKQEKDEEDKDEQEETAAKPAVEVATNPELKGELLTLRLRYKQPEESESTKIEVSVANKVQKFAFASTDFRFASSVAGFGLLLRNSHYKGEATFDAIRNIAAESLGEDTRGYRTEFIELIDAVAHDWRTPE